MCPIITGVYVFNLISFSIFTAKKKQPLRDIFGALNARRVCFLLFSVLSTENNKVK